MQIIKIKDKYYNTKYMKTLSIKGLELDKNYLEIGIKMIGDKKTFYLKTELNNSVNPKTLKDEIMGNFEQNIREKRMGFNFNNYIETYGVKND